MFTICSARLEQNQLPPPRLGPARTVPTCSAPLHKLNPPFCSSPIPHCLCSCQWQHECHLLIACHYLHLDISIRNISVRSDHTEFQSWNMTAPPYGKWQPGHIWCITLLVKVFCFSVVLQSAILPTFSRLLKAIPRLRSRSHGLNIVNSRHLCSDRFGPSRRFHAPLHSENRSGSSAVSFLIQHTEFPFVLRIIEATS